MPDTLIFSMPRSEVKYLTNAAGDYQKHIFIVQLLPMAASVKHRAVKNWALLEIRFYFLIGQPLSTSSQY